MLRSDGYLPDRGTQIYVADTIGELGLFYSLAPVALLGRSVIGRGGQNPIEAAKLGAAILHGPNVGNFEEVYQRLDAANGAMHGHRCRDAGGGGAAAADRRGRAARMVAAAQATITSLSGALDRTLAAIDPYLVQIRLERH